MTGPSSETVKLQVIATADTKSSASAENLSARDYSQNFRERVAARFVVTLNIKQTARDFAIPARVVNDILHITNFKRPMSVARESFPRYVGVERRRA